ncbi:Hsp20 family protein [Bradyrhizobium jicamae]|uniref:Hsp20 family protein n=1 Tax=Bradyrhizobium jicamae TaxID=280332 RepID=UPI0009FAA537
MGDEVIPHKIVAYLRPLRATLPNVLGRAENPVQAPPSHDVRIERVLWLLRTCKLETSLRCFFRGCCRLPNGVDGKKVEASLRKGRLQMTLQTQEAQKLTRKIQVKDHPLRSLRRRQPSEAGGQPGTKTKCI